MGDKEYDHYVDQKSQEFLTLGMSPQFIELSNLKASIFMVFRSRHTT